MTGEALRGVVCGAALAALGYGVYQSMQEEDNSSTGRSVAPDFTNSGNAYLRCMPTLSAAAHDILPMLSRIDADKAEVFLQNLEMFAECGVRTLVEPPPRPLVEAQQLKRKITRTLKELNKQGRRSLPIETGDASEDFNQLVGHMNDALHNMQQDTSLKMQGA